VFEKPDKLNNDNTERGELTAEEVNDKFNEAENVVRPFMAFNESDDRQMLKSIDIMSKANFYLDKSLRGDTIELKRGATADKIETLFDGLTLAFTPNKDYQGVVYLKLGDNPKKEIKYNGGALPDSFIIGGDAYRIVFVEADDAFEIRALSGNSWFGAKGDGVADDSDAFFKAPNFSIVPKGTYKIDTSVSFSGKKFILEEGAKIITDNKSLFFYTQTNKEKTYESLLGDSVEIIAHRGFRGTYPQNTMLAFTSAFQAGADSLEFDVQITSDDELVVFHDETVDTLTNGTGKVVDLSLSQLRGLKFKSLDGTIYENERIPTFSEVLKFARENGIFVYPEIKHYKQESDISRMVEKVISYNMEEICLFQSFKMSDLEYLRDMNSTIEIGILGSSTTGYEASVDKMEQLGRGSLLWNHNSLKSNPQIVKYARSRGVDVATWTIDRQYEVDEMMRIGVKKVMCDIKLGGRKW